MPKTKLHELSEFGQSVWLDFISRPLLETGRLKSLIDQGLRGMTSNPTIFNQSISLTSDYDQKIIQLSEQGKSNFEIYDELTIQDVREAADIFKGVYIDTQGLDGYVSLEINPKLARKTQESINEGKRLFAKVNRPNIMIKVPSTPEGFPVIEELLASGIPVNVTLMFSLQQYIDTTQAFLKGLTRFAQSGGDLKKIQSVASVFVSRIDTSVDKLLDEKIAKAQNETIKNQLTALKGKGAVANCHFVFEKFNEIFKSEGGAFKNLAKKNANMQRVLWASTGTKNPQYSDIKYITELITKPTVNTVPEKTLSFVLDHAVVKPAFNYSLSVSQQILDGLHQQGIDVNQVCQKLLDEGVTAFEKSFEELLSSIEQKVKRLCPH